MEQNYDTVIQTINSHIDLEILNDRLNLEIENYKKNWNTSLPKAVLIYDNEGESYPLLGIYIIAESYLKQEIDFRKKRIHDNTLKLNPIDQLAKQLIYKEKIVLELMQKHNYPTESCAGDWVELFHPEIFGDDWNNFLWSLSIYTGIYLKTQEKLIYSITVRCVEHDCVEDYKFLKV